MYIWWFEAPELQREHLGGGAGVLLTTTRGCSRRLEGVLAFTRAEEEEEEEEAAVISTTRQKAGILPSQPVNQIPTATLLGFFFLTLFLLTVGKTRSTRRIYS